MTTLTYNLPNDIHTYVITCNEELFELYINLLKENGAYLIMADNVTVYDGALKWIKKATNYHTIY